MSKENDLLLREYLDDLFSKSSLPECMNEAIKQYIMSDEKYPLYITMGKGNGKAFLDECFEKYKEVMRSMKRNIYHTCPDCGANLDPGEICDCQKETSCEDGVCDIVFPEEEDK